MTFWTTDPDGMFGRAVAAGATPVAPVDDVFSGDRMGVIRDPAGIRWCLARHDRDVSPEELAAATEKVDGRAGRLTIPVRIANNSPIQKGQLTKITHMR